MSLSLYTAATECVTKERHSSLQVGHFKLQSRESQRVSFPGSCGGCTTAWNETRVWLAGPLPELDHISPHPPLPCETYPLCKKLTFYHEEKNIGVQKSKLQQTRSLPMSDIGKHERCVLETRPFLFITCVASYPGSSPEATHVSN